MFLYSICSCIFILIATAAYNHESFGTKEHDDMSCIYRHDFRTFISTVDLIKKSKQASRKRKSKLKVYEPPIYSSLQKEISYHYFKHIIDLWKHLYSKGLRPDHALIFQFFMDENFLHMIDSFDYCIFLKLHYHFKKKYCCFIQDFIDRISFEISGEFDKIDTANEHYLLSEIFIQKVLSDEITIPDVELVVYNDTIDPLNEKNFLANLITGNEEKENKFVVDDMYQDEYEKEEFSPGDSPLTRNSQFLHKFEEFDGFKPLDSSKEPNTEIRLEVSNVIPITKKIVNPDFFVISTSNLSIAEESNFGLESSHLSTIEQVQSKKIHTKNVANDHLLTDEQKYNAKTQKFDLKTEEKLNRLEIILKSYQNYNPEKFLNLMNVRFSLLQPTQKSSSSANIHDTIKTQIKHKPFLRKNNCTSSNTFCNQEETMENATLRTKNISSLSLKVLLTPEAAHNDTSIEVDLDNIQMLDGTEAPTKELITSHAIGTLFKDRAKIKFSVNTNPSVKNNNEDTFKSGIIEKNQKKPETQEKYQKENVYDILQKIELYRIGNFAKRLELRIDRKIYDKINMGELKNNLEDIILMKTYLLGSLGSFLLQKNATNLHEIFLDDLFYKKNLLDATEHFLNFHNHRLLLFSVTNEEISKLNTSAEDPDLVNSKIEVESIYEDYDELFSKNTRLSKNPFKRSISSALENTMHIKMNVLSSNNMLAEANKTESNGSSFRNKSTRSKNIFENAQSSEQVMNVTIPHLNENQTKFDSFDSDAELLEHNYSEREMSQNFLKFEESTEYENKSKNKSDIFKRVKIKKVSKKHADKEKFFLPKPKSLEYLHRNENNIASSERMLDVSSDGTQNYFYNYPILAALILLFFYFLKTRFS